MENFSLVVNNSTIFERTTEVIQYVIPFDLTIVMAVNTFVASILLHELGHTIYAYLRLKKENPQYLAKFGIVDGKFKFWALNPHIMVQLDEIDRILMAVSGIMSGLIPIVFAVLVNYYALMILPLYAIGCVADVKLIIDNYKLWKEKKKVKTQ